MNVIVILDTIRIILMFNVKFVIILVKRVLHKVQIV